ncbi:hypothetical protein SMACR_07709 [Sordaria macrospora]|uniref:WGS project CABT00000000 data, contig 2.27 n=2 Tax=Sordaria macrospora TaxID=5147 RepID=F7W4E0_SORMK|nr:uncharacterized protein SMAC_07709 [Sordaria macrospora k-hell]KAA8634897.1 hypothetical protein SMACR_07709 [Sordaria macrospora]KAH7635460.1 hypothetical protein B0T09DRAFT_379254 [Sordaria sp. MPI-SDFR-AT-0083]WPJ67392.1 hypothetical protein SMAC4_07709 [Sordaria macrospora]CCC14893.1 unnamed protein product [Sordaria macrospora k-hell]
MQLTTILTTLLATVAIAAPAPAPEAIAEPAPILEARAQDLIDLWKNKNFLDLKFTGSANVGDCKNLPSNFNDISSSGKAKAGFRCTIWVDKDCKGTGFSFNQNPGSASFPDWINDKASSWKCVKA